MEKEIIKTKKEFLENIEEFLPAIKHKMETILSEVCAYRIDEQDESQINVFIEDLSFDIVNILESKKSNQFLSQFEGMDEEEISERLKDLNFDELSKLYIKINIERKMESEKKFLQLLKSNISLDTREIFFDLDETLISYAYNEKWKKRDFIRPVAQIILNELKRLNIKISILTTRSSKYIPKEIRKFVNGVIIGRDESLDYKEKYIDKYGVENVPYENKACFAKLADDGVLIIDDAHYAKKYDNCVYVSDSEKFFL